jgi:hypothetical protein
MVLLQTSLNGESLKVLRAERPEMSRNVLYPFVRASSHRVTVRDDHNQQTSGSQEVRGTPYVLCRKMAVLKNVVEVNDIERFFREVG